MIELVIVIVILGILATAALPKFVDLKDDARNAGLAAVGGAITTGSANNYAAKLAGKATALTINQANVCTTAILGSLLTSSFPAGVDVYQTGVNECTTDEFAWCRLMDDTTGQIATIKVICAR